MEHLSPRAATILIAMAVVTVASVVALLCGGFASDVTKPSSVRLLRLARSLSFALAVGAAAVVLLTLVQG
ncbi:hypothetical protein [Falsirhodobacter halotolerans]|uniref:hypothetical protein n=1 Tax=Falsirhodobacter halotolerans TaxID=1146892 RepID=UPI001FD56693|nr:hypothetical protein [Falsirhodobacter halotolerans]MCJ8138498.1 hypothetical protein [Falsirhodobacter halotolerans]